MKHSSTFQVQCKKIGPSMDCPIEIRSRVFTLVQNQALSTHSCFQNSKYIIVYVCVDIRLLLNSTRNGCNFISWHISLQQYKLDDEALFLCSTSEWANRHHDLCSMKIVNAILHSYKYIIKY